MARAVIEAILITSTGTRPKTYDLLADTGAGSDRAKFELVLDEFDCRAYGRRTSYRVELGGAFSESFLIYLVRIQIPQLSLDHSEMGVA